MTATIGMDPRIRARREEVAAEADRRRWARFAVVGAIAALLFAVVASTRSPLLDVDTIVVEGSRHTSADAVRAVSGVTPGDPLTELDLGQARLAIAAMPWVKTVTSQRGWDGTVTFSITERRAVAQTISADGSAVTLVDAEGRVLDVLDAPRDDLVAVVGARGSVAPGGWLASSSLDAVAIAAAIPPGLASHVDEVSVDDQGTIELLVAGVGEVVLGGSNELAAKFLALETMLDQVDLGCVQVIDLQVPTVPVLTRYPSC